MKTRKIGYFIKTAAAAAGLLVLARGPARATEYEILAASFTVDNQVNFASVTYYGKQNTTPANPAAATPGTVMLSPGGLYYDGTYYNVWTGASWVALATGTLPSGGVAPRLPYWTSSTGLGNSCLAQDSANSLSALGASTLTVQGAAFSVGGSTFVVAAGSVGIGIAIPGATLDVQNGGVINALTGYRANGTALGGNYLRGNGTNFVANTIQNTDLPGSFSGFAAPAANSVSISAPSAGTATSAIRSDATLQLSQAIAPTWTGQHTFTNATYSALFTGGNVGIGTAAPGYALQINSSYGAEPYLQAYFDSTMAAGYGGIGINGINQSHVRFFLGDVNKWQIRVGEGAGTDAMSIYSYTKTADVIYFKNDGNVGIGTATPRSPLDVQSAAASLTESVGNAAQTSFTDLALYTNNGSGQIWEGGTGYSSYGGANSLNIYNSVGGIAFHPGSVQNAMYIAPTSGNVGIGTSTPLTPLTITADANANTLRSWRNANTVGWGVPGVVMALNDSASAVVDYASVNASIVANTAGAASGNLAFYTRNAGTLTQQMTILNTGNVGIGTSVPGHALDAQGSDGKINAANALCINNSCATSWTSLSPWQTVGGAVVDLVAPANTVMVQSTMAVQGAAFSVGGSTFVVASGNVGIGTSAPGQALDANGVINSASGYKIANGLATAGNYLRGNGTNFVAGTILLGDLPTLSGSFIQNQTAADQAAGFRITGNGVFNGGNVGVGVTNPTYPLVLYNLVSTGAIISGFSADSNASRGDAGSLLLGNNAQYYGLLDYTGANNTALSLDNSYDNAGAAIKFRMRTWSPTNAFTAMAILGSGNVGIGTSSPAALFYVVGASTFAVTGAGNVGIGTSNPVYTLHAVGAEYNTGQDVVGGTMTVIGAAFSVGGSTFVVAASSVGVGTLSPGHALDVQGADGRINAVKGVCINNSCVDNSWASMSPWLSAGSVVYLVTAGNNVVAQSSLTVQGNAFSVGGSSFVVALGNVGIGTTNPPASRLWVSNAAAGGTDDYMLTVENPTTAADARSGIRFWANALDSAGAAIKVNNNGAAGGNISFITNTSGADTTQLFIQASNGNVGIGTASPLYALHVAGANGFYDAGQGVVAGTMTVQGAAFSVNGSGLVLAGGNVGIGAAAPVANLEVAHTSGGAGSKDIVAQFDSTYVSGESGPTIALKAGGVVGGAITGVSETGGWPGALIFHAHGTPGDNNLGSGVVERMRITSGGNVGIGTASPLNALAVNNAVSTGAVISGFSADANAANAANGALQLGSNVQYAGLLDYIGTGSSGIFSIDNTYNSVNAVTRFRMNTYSAANTITAMTIMGTGNVGIGTTNPIYTLDVNGTLRLSGAFSVAAPFQVNGANQSIIIANATSGYGAIDLWSAGATKVLLGYAAAAGNYGAQTAAGDVSLKANNTNLHFVTGSGSANTAMVIQAGGNVGIGTASPGALLSLGAVASDVPGSMSLLFTDSAVGNRQMGLRFSATPADDMAFDRETGGVWYEAMRIQRATGYVGVGTTGPARLLDVNGVVNSATGFTVAAAAASGNYLRGNGTNFVPNTIQAGDIPDLSGTYIKNQTGADQTGGFRVTGNGLFNGGCVGIGTASPISQLTLSGNAGTAGPVLGPATIFASDNADAVGSGGAIVFGGETGYYFAGIKGYLQDGTPNTRGALAFYLRNAVGDTNLTEYMRIASNGNVGIGTASPVQKLDLNGGSITMGALNAAGAITFRNDIAVGASGSVGIAAIDAALNGNSDGLGLYVSDGLKIFAGTTPLLTVIAASGNVGIGTTAPSDVLDVNAPAVFGVNTGDRASISGTSLGFNRKVVTGAIYNSGAYAYQFQHTGSATQGSDNLALQVYNTGGTNITPMALAVNGYGYVGIGTSNPSALLSLGATTNNKKLLLYDNPGTPAYYGFGIQSEQFIFFTADAAARYSFYDTSALANELVTIKSNGNVGIGTSAPAAKLDVNGSINVSGVMQYPEPVIYTFGATETRYLKIYNPSATADSDRWLKFKMTSSNNSEYTVFVEVYIPTYFNWSGGYNASPPYIITYGGGLRTQSPTFINFIVASSVQGDFQLWLQASGANNRTITLQSFPGSDALSLITTQTGVPSNILYTYPISANGTVLAGGDTMIPSGNVGIGTTNPATLLHVNAGATTSGGIQIDGTSQPELTLANGGSVKSRFALATGAGQYSNDSATNDLIVRSEGTKILFNTNSGSASSLAINGGNVGIGTASPARALVDYYNGHNYLRIQGAGTGYDAAAEYYDGTNYAYSGLMNGSGGGAGNFAIYNSGIKMVVTPSGNVGIGTTSPSGRLDVLAGAARTGTHATTPSFYVTGTLADGTAGPAANNIEFRHDNGTQGIGFGYQTIYQAGSNANTPLNLLSKGSGPITLNAYAYGTGNVGIGTSAPAALLNTYLPASGSSDREVARFGANGGNPYITLGNATTSTGGGYYLFDSTNYLIRMGVHGNTAITINNSGRVGIGRTNPDVPLAVLGAIRDIEPTGGLNIIDIVPGTAANSIYTNWYSGGTNVPLILGTWNYKTTQLVLDANGDVGIGAASPSTNYNLYVSGAEYATGNIIGNGCMAASSGWNCGSQSAAIYTTGVIQGATLLGTGNTQHPADTLYFGSASYPAGVNFFIDRGYTGGAFIFGYNTAKGSGANSFFQIYNNSTDRALLFMAQSAGTSSGSNNIFLMQSGGNVGIGTTAPGSPLHVTGWASGYGYMMQLNTGQTDSGHAGNQINLTNTANTWGLILGQDNGSIANTYTYHGPNNAYVVNYQNAPVILGANNTAAMSVFSNSVSIGATNPSSTPSQTLTVTGTAGNTTGVWVNNSDIRLKKDLLPIEHPLDTVMRLEGKSFRWRDPQKGQDPGRVMGFIAQDVEKVLPQWVKNTGENGYKQIEPVGDIALLVEAIKEQEREIQDLKKRLAAFLTVVKLKTPAQPPANEQPAIGPPPKETRKE